MIDTDGWDGVSPLLFIAFLVSFFYVIIRYVQEMSDLFAERGFFYTITVGNRLIVYQHPRLIVASLVAVVSVFGLFWWFNR